MVQSPGRGAAAGRGQAHRSAACGRCSEAEQGPRSAFCKGAPAARSKNGAPQPGGVRSKIKLQTLACSAVRAAWPVWTLRWPRGGGRVLRLPLPTPSGLPTHPQRPEASLWTQKRKSQRTPLALSRFLRRGAAPACKNRSAAPNTAPCFVHRTRSLCLPNGL